MVKMRYLRCKEVLLRNWERNYNCRLCSSIEKVEDFQKDIWSEEKGFDKQAEQMKHAGNK